MSKYASMFNQPKDFYPHEIQMPKEAGQSDLQNLMDKSVGQPMRVAPTTGLSAAAQAKLEKARQIKDQMTLSEFGTDSGKQIDVLADTILQKTKTGKMGEFGDGITDILKLTQTVNVDDMNIDKSKGLLGKITTFFKEKKVDVMVQFESTADSISKIADDLTLRQTAMKTDNEFLDKMYDANLVEYHELGSAVEAIGALVEELKVEHQNRKMEAESSGDQFKIQEVNQFEQNIILWEKQMDRLKRMQHVALIQAPEIRQLQNSNVLLVQKFHDLKFTTLPAWKKQLSLTIQAIRQKENAALGNKIDDQTNALFLKASELTSSNAIAVAKSSQRSVVDMSTLETMQANMINSVKEIKNIEEAGRKERAEASLKIDKMREEMKREMLSW